MLSKAKKIELIHDLLYFQSLSEEPYCIYSILTKEKEQIILALPDFGVVRFPDIRKMSLFGNPWDGYTPLQQMVKWISSN